MHCTYYTLNAHCIHCYAVCVVFFAFSRIHRSTQSSPARRSLDQPAQSPPQTPTNLCESFLGQIPGPFREGDNIGSPSQAQLRCFGHSADYVIGRAWICPSLLGTFSRFTLGDRREAADMIDRIVCGHVR